MKRSFLSFLSLAGQGEGKRSVSESPHPNKKRCKVQIEATTNPKTTVYG